MAYTLTNNYQKY